jgi:hypothetical protein
MCVATFCVTLFWRGTATLAALQATWKRLIRSWLPMHTVNHHSQQSDVTVNLFLRKHTDGCGHKKASVAIAFAGRTGAACSSAILVAKLSIPRWRYALDFENPKGAPRRCHQSRLEWRHVALRLSDPRPSPGPGQKDAKVSGRAQKRKGNTTVALQAGRRGGKK